MASVNTAKSFQAFPNLEEDVSTAYKTSAKIRFTIFTLYFPFYPEEHAEISPPPFLYPNSTIHDCRSGGQARQGTARDGWRGTWTC
jgi:hypothetical protein